MRNPLQKETSAIGLAITDLFISATAALLVIIALSDSADPLPMPVQSDLVFFCPVESPAETGAAFGLAMPDDLSFDQARQATVDASRIAPFSSARELVALAAIQSAASKSLYTGAVVAASMRPLTAECLRNLNAIARTLDRADAETRTSGMEPILTIRATAQSIKVVTHGE